MRALCYLLIIFGVHFYFISEGLYSIQTHVLLFIFFNSTDIRSKKGFQNSPKMIRK